MVWTSAKYFKFIAIWLLSTSVYAAVNIDTLPSSLPDPETPQSINTPEYVVIQPKDQVTFSSETIASIAVLAVKEGSTFMEGDILIELDCRIQEAELRKAQAQQEVAAKSYKSAMTLQKYGSISGFEVAKARSEAEAANADVSKLQVIVEKCVIVAPFKGAVSELMVHPYETVKPGDPLLKIVSTENLEVEIQIPSTWLLWLHVGAIFHVHINEINKTVTARVILINPQIEPISQSVKIIGVITPPVKELRPGMSGQASFPENPNKIKEIR
jgi:membrane fusion protein (multidrug efflux system)